MLGLFSAVPILSAFWIYFDATQHQIGRVTDAGRLPNYSGLKRGRLLNFSALDWAIGALALWIVCFPWYIIRRPALIERANESPVPARNRPAGFLLLALASVVALSLYGFIPVSALLGSLSASNGPVGTGLAVAPGLPVPQPAQVHRLSETRAQFLAAVDEKISGPRIAGNPFKFVGQRVDLHCNVVNVVDFDGQPASNLLCGEANILLTGDVSRLEGGQSIRVLGMVTEPQPGVNTFGGVARFPTVVARWVDMARAAEE
jgi:hypothetical protein